MKHASRRPNPRWGSTRRSSLSQTHSLLLRTGSNRPTAGRVGGVFRPHQPATCPYAPQTSAGVPFRHRPARQQLSPLRPPAHFRAFTHFVVTRSSHCVTPNQRTMEFASVAAVACVDVTKRRNSQREQPQYRAAFALDNRQLTFPTSARLRPWAGTACFPHDAAISATLRPDHGCCSASQVRTGPRVPAAECRRQFHRHPCM